MGSAPSVQPRLTGTSQLRRQPSPIPYRADHRRDSAWPAISTCTPSTNQNAPPLFLTENTNNDRPLGSITHLLDIQMVPGTFIGLSLFRGDRLDLGRKPRMRHRIHRA